MGNNYGNESIKMLKGSDRIRKRPEVMLTTRKIDGMRHTVTEIAGNSLDEMASGFGDKLVIKYHKDYSITIRDYGRGVPLGWNEKEQQWNWHLVYNEMYAGAKYDDTVEIDEELFNSIDLAKLEDLLKKFTYLFPIGTNGLGAYSTQATSEFLEVKSYHNKIHGDYSTPMVRSRMLFETGNPALDELEVTPTEEKSGTEVHWKPDLEVFTDATTNDLGFDWLYELCEDIANLKGYVIELYNESEDKLYTINGKGIEELLRAKAGKNLDSDKLLTKREAVKGSEMRGKNTVRYIAVADIVMGITSKKVSPICFHNTTRMLRGVTYSAISEAVDSFFYNRAKESDVKLQQSDYSGLLTFIVSTYSSMSSYENQTKQGVTNSFLYNIVSKGVSSILDIEWGKGNTDLKRIVNSAIEEAATRAKIKAYEKQQRDIKKASSQKRNLEKLAECESTDKSLIELWIPEGDSAARSIKDARDNYFQAVLPIRGKIINVLKAPIEKVLDCDVVKDIFATLGCYMDLPGTDLFDIRDVKYSKIIFATDADEDGFQIRVLLFILFYKLAPQLLKAGMVYIAETPLFEIVVAGNKSLYAYDKEEKEEIMQKYGSSVVAVHRSKGLGENMADMLRATTLAPETRRLVQLNIDVNDMESANIINSIFGKDRNKQRKDFILQTLGMGLDDMFEIADEEIEASEEAI